VPLALTEQASVQGIPDARYWLDRDIGPFIRDVSEFQRREMAFFGDEASAGLPPINMLAISGGGESGAFAAGLLAGWSQHGTRPMFTVVTGVSVGALIAPFAFLGANYDELLREIATTITPKSVFRRRNVLLGLFADGMASSKPLAKMVARHVTQEVLDAIAVEHAKGRALQIGTTDLDSGRPVTWSMSAIAASGAPGALKLFHRVMIASMSIPGAVSPVMFDVQIGDQQFQELHVDGGVISQIFAYPRPSIAALEKERGRPFDRPIHIYVIRNGKLTPDWFETKRSTLGVSGRAIGTLIKNQGITDVTRIYETAQQDGADFNLGFIDDDFLHPTHDTFDREFMRHLFEHAYQLGLHGYRWHKAPPTGIRQT
jgi:hypothetical protein